MIAGAVGQNMVVLSGKVINRSNEPIPGASVVVYGTSRSVMANIKGVFSLKLTIVVSSTGYINKSIDEVNVSVFM